MMNPQMMQMAMEQMNRMTPEQMAALQAQMGSISPEMMQQQMNYFNSMSPDQQAQVQRQASSVTPEQIAAGAGRFQQQAGGQQSSRLQSANSLKTAGNSLHKQGSYRAASEKYEQALTEAAGHTGQDADELSKACRLNLSLCYLNMGRYTACATSCSEVLQSEPANRKALYRRGQAHLGSGNYESAIKDLKAAVKLAPADERAIIQEKLSLAQEKAGRRIDDIEDSDDDDDIETVQANGTSSALPRDRPTQIEEISEPSSRAASSTGQGSTVSQGGGGVPQGMPRPSAQQLKDMAAQLKANPAMAESMFNVSPEQMEMMAKMSGVSMPPGMTPEMMKQASSMLSGMSAEDLDRLATQAGPGFPSSSPSAPSMPPRPTPAEQARSSEPSAAAAAASAPASVQRPVPGASPAGAQGMGGGSFQQAANMMQANPGMMKMAMDMMQKMPPEQMAAMQQQAMGGGVGRPGAAGMPSPDQMKDMESMLNNPEMMQGMQDMLGSMTPEDLSAMSRQAGMNISPEQAEQMTKQLKKLTPKQMAVLMGTMRFLQQAREFVKARKMLVISVVVLLVALFLRWLGYI